MRSAYPDNAFAYWQVYGCRNYQSIFGISLLCFHLDNSLFESEAKDVLKDCDEYEVRLLVDLLKSAKEAIRRDKKARNQFEQ